MEISTLYKFSKSLLSFILISLLGLNGSGLLHAENLEFKADLAEEVESLESEQETEEKEGDQLEKDYVNAGIVSAFQPCKAVYANKQKLPLTARELISIDPPPERI